MQPTFTEKSFSVSFENTGFIEKTSHLVPVSPSMLPTGAAGAAVFSPPGLDSGGTRDARRAQGAAGGRAGG